MTSTTLKSLAIASFVSFSLATPHASAGEPTRLAQAYFAGLAAGDLHAVTALLAPDVIWHQPGASVLSGTYHGRNEVTELFQRFHALSGGSFRITAVDHIMENGPLVSACLHFAAQRQDDSSDVRISMAGSDVMRIAAGKIAEVWLFSADQASEDNFWGHVKEGLEEVAER